MRKSVWTALGAIIVVVAAVIIYAVVHKPAKTTPASTTTTSTSQQTTGTTSNTTTTSAADIIQTKTASNVGQYLADSNGNALYTYGADTQGKSNCDGACLYNWPIYDASSAPATLPANVTVITRSDGGKQYAYKSMPLYTFTSDSKGQVTGDGVENFHVAKP
jgi:predicted lipoprotein with Yx(FWY)xxD motif